MIFTAGPVISTVPKDTELVTGTPLSLTVTFDSFNLPLSEITWFIDGTPAAEVNERVNIVNTDIISPPTTSTLSLNILFPNEGGQYSVTAVNPAGVATTAVNVTVYCKQILFYVNYYNIVIMSLPASAVIIFPSGPINLSVTEGNQTTLTCTARGVPAPEFMWYRGSELINGSDTRLEISSNQMLNDTTGFIYVTSELNVMVLNRTDDGVFRCEATNNALVLMSDSQTYQITVNCKFKPHAYSYMH